MDRTGSRSVAGGGRGAWPRAGAVVALESTLIAQGLPWPENLETARAAEAAVRRAGAVPATIAVLGGVVRVGLTADELERIAPARGGSSRRAGATWRLAVARGLDAATTVSATLWLARRPGIGVMATGGLGGVHRDAATTLRRLDRPRRAGPRRRHARGLLGGQVDPRRAGHARSAGDARGAGRRLPDRRVAGLHDPLERPAAGVAGRLARRGRRAWSGRTGRWACPARSCWRSRSPRPTRSTATRWKPPSPTPWPRPAPGGSRARPSPRSSSTASATPPAAGASAPTSP